jgi:hypothetical protein
MTLRPRPKYHTARDIPGARDAPAAARTRAPQRGACTASASAPDCGALAGAPDRGALAGAPDRGAVHLHTHTATGVNPPRAPAGSCAPRAWDFYGFTAS